LLLNSIEENCELSRDQIARFKLDVLALIGPKLLPIASESMALAKDFMTGSISESAIASALERCWNSSDQNRGLTTPESNSTRAVICLLYGLIHGEKDDVVDSLSFFLTLVNNVEPHVSRELELLHRHFRDCLGDEHGSAWPQSTS